MQLPFHFIIDNVAVANTVTADGSGSWTFTPVLTDGNHTVVAFETNGVGTGVASTSFTLDTTAPAAPTVALTTDSGSSNSDHITNVGTLNVTGVEAGALVEYSTNGGSTWSSSFTAVEGLDNVQVRETDVAGNHSTATSFSFTLDTTAPAAPTVALTTDSGSSNSDHITNVGTLNVTGVEAGALVEYSTNGGSTWSSSFTAVEGLDNVQVRETDVAGNHSTATSFSFTLDTTAPAAPTVALTTDSGSSNSDHITNVGTLNVTGVEAGALVEYSTNGGSTWSSSFTAVEGLDNVQVRETDVAGNHSTATSFSFTLDTTAPAAPTVALTTDSGSSNSDHITNVGTLNVTGVEAGALVEYSTNGGSTWSSSFTAVEGLDNVQVRETDVAGNHSTATSFSFTLDTTAPAAPTVALTTDSGSSNSDHITNVGTLNVTGVEAGALVEYSTNGGSTWSSSFTAVEGLDNVQVRETDVAGNHSTATSFSFTLDTTAPAAPTVALTTDSGSSNSDHITNVGTLNVTGVEAGALVEYSTNGGSTWSSSFTAVEGLDNVQVRETTWPATIRRQPRSRSRWTPRRRRRRR